MGFLLKQNLAGYWTLDGHAADMTPATLTINQLSNTAYDKSIYASDTSAWATARNATTGTARDGSYVQSTLSGATRFIERGFLTFDTSALPDGARILSATLSIYGVVDAAAKTNSPSYRLYNSTHTDSIVGADYDLMGTTEQSDTYFDQLTISAWNDFIFNAAGLANINKTGTTKLCIREAVYDLGNVQPTGSNVIQFHDVTSNASFAPKLTISYLPANNGTVTGALPVPSKNPAMPASLAYKFNGTSDYISLTDNATLKPTGSFTVSGWFKTSDAPAVNYPTIIQSYSQVSTVAGWEIMMNPTGANNTLRFVVGRNTGVTFGTDYNETTSSNRINDNNWHFFNCVHENGARLNVYIDGKLKGTTAYTAGVAYAATNYVRIGCNNITGTNQYFWNGNLQDIAILNKALSAQEIQTIYNQSKRKYGNKNWLSGIINAIRTSDFFQFFFN